MSDDGLKGWQPVPEAERTPHGHSGNLADRRVSAESLNRALRILVADPTTRNVRAFFGNRASASAIKMWRQGNRSIPAWAVEHVGNQLAAAHESFSRIKCGPGNRGNPETLRAINYAKRNQPKP